MIGQMPLVEKIQLNGVEIALMHGHGGLLPYLWDKWQFILFGYRLKRYLHLLIQAAGSAKVIVFGHTHQPEALWHSNKLLFNPGSASFGRRPGQPPTIGLLRVYTDGAVSSEFIKLEGYQVKNRKWEPC
jgi:predicted phosphodiesterase